jgi:hypothetical protein
MTEKKKTTTRKRKNTEGQLAERLLCHMLFLERDSLQVQFHGMDEHGQVTFSFPVKDISDAELRSEISKCKSLMKAMGPFHCDMLGGLVIRRNMSTFFDFFMSLSDSDYSEKLLPYDHVHFGIGCNGEAVSMLFHCSLLYEIFIGMVNNIASGGQ